MLQYNVIARKVAQLMSYQIGRICIKGLVFTLFFRVHITLYLTFLNIFFTLNPQAPYQIYHLQNGCMYQKTFLLSTGSTLTQPIACSYSIPRH